MRGRHIANSLVLPTHTLQKNFHCGSRNVVYLLQCSCKKQYVGQTKTKFRSRYHCHKSHTKSDIDYCADIHRHVNLEGHPFEGFTFAILGGGFKTDSERLAYENLMIEKFDTKNMGLNISPGYT